MVHSRIFKNFNTGINVDMEEFYNETLGMVKTAIKITEKAKMENSQTFLNFLDELNQLSVKY